MNLRWRAIGWVGALTVVVVALSIATLNYQHRFSLTRRYEGQMTL